MGKALRLAGVLTFLCADMFGQSINSVTVSPQNPTSNDDVTLVVNGDKWSSDVYISSITTSQNFNTWTVDIEFLSGGGIGLPVLVPFDTIVSLSAMPIGYYDAQVNGVFNNAVQDFDGATWAVQDPVGLTSSAASELKFMCTPNPFSDETTLTLSVPKSGGVKLKVYDILGQEVASVIDRRYDSGIHQMKYLGAGLTAGRYYFHLISSDETIVYSILKK